MSTRGTRRVRAWLGRPRDVDNRLAALVGTAVLTAAYGSVLYHVTDVVGGSRAMLAVLVGVGTLGLVMGRLLRPRVAAVLTGCLLVGGAGTYVLSVPASQRAVLSVGRVVSDTVALLTGLSVLRLTRANVWALSVAPPPVFLSWYLVTRRRYVAGVAVGLGMLSLFVLTGDASEPVALVGVAGAAATVGFGALDRYGGTDAQTETLVIVIAATVAVAAVVPAVAGAGLTGTGGGPVLPDRTAPTGQASLVDATDRLEIVGSITLSPRVQFRVESTERAYWQTAAYDRYTGGGWVQSGESGLYDEGLPEPPGAARTVRQTVTAEIELGSMPAAWKPVRVSNVAPSRVAVTSTGGIRPVSTIDPGESYTVVSRLPRRPPFAEQSGAPDYPAAVVERYTQVPSSTPDRVARRAAEVTADADSPAAAAAAVEAYLESRKRYSLSVERPDGDVADAFLFEMNAGYCTYFATTMVTMLRTQGIPARFVTGYTSGQRVDGQWVVRGFDSHAWVQVYVPDVGWVRFDPTPAGPRRAAERSSLTEARQSGQENVDVAGSNATTPTTPTPTPSANVSTDLDDIRGNQSGTPNASAIGANATVDTGDGTIRGGGPDLPPPETLVLWAILLAGVVALVRRTDAVTRCRRAVWLRRRGPRRDPERDAIRAFDRLAYLLQRRHRPRRPGETPREYVDRLVDHDRAAPVYRAYERARYGDGVDRETADAAVDAVDRLVRERTLPTRPFVARDTDGEDAETGRPDTV